MCDCAGYGYLPVTTDTNLAMLRSGRLREFSVRLALPKNLETTSQQQVAIKAGMAELMAPNIAPMVEVSYASRLRQPDLQPGAFERLARWLRRERRAHRGAIDMVRAKVIDADGDAIPLDLLEEVHLRDNSDVTLPDDDPDESYAIRNRHIGRVFEKHRELIHRQFG
jgi:hypothetical protein